MPPNGAVKLVAQVDEFFLDSVSSGREGIASVNGRDYDVTVSRVFP